MQQNRPIMYQNYPQQLSDQSTNYPGAQQQTMIGSSNIEPQQFTGYVPPKPRKSKLPILLIIVPILMIILLSISLILPWYTITFIDTYSHETEYRYSFTNIEVMIVDETESFSWDDFESTDFKSVDNLKNVYLATMSLVILGIIMSILLLITIIMMVKGRSKSKNLVLTFSVLAVIFCVLPTIMFMGLHTSAMKSDNEDLKGNGPWDSFLGYEAEYSHMQGLTPTDFKSTELHWSPSVGWGLSILASVMAGVGLILAIILPKPESMANNIETSQTQFGQQQPPTQYNQQPPTQYNKQPPY